MVKLAMSVWLGLMSMFLVVLKVFAGATLTWWAALLPIWIFPATAIAAASGILALVTLVFVAIGLCLLVAALVDVINAWNAARRLRALGQITRSIEKARRP